MYFYNMTSKTQTTADLYAMLDARRQELGLSNMQLGQLAFGRPDTSAMTNLRRGSSPTFDRLNLICEALGYELYCGPPRPKAADTILCEEEAPTDFNQPSALRAGYLPLPWHHLVGRSGSSPIALMPDFIDALGISVSNLRVVPPETVLIPLECDARTVLAIIDVEARAGAAAQVWALLERGRVIVARIQSQREALVIHQLSEDKGVRLVTGTERDATKLLGRVVWLGQPMTMKLPTKGGMS